MSDWRSSAVQAYYQGWWWTSHVGHSVENFLEATLRKLLSPIKEQLTLKPSSGCQHHFDPLFHDRSIHQALDSPSIPPNLRPDSKGQYGYVRSHPSVYLEHRRLLLTGRRLLHWIMHAAEKNMAAVVIRGSLL